MFNKLRPHLLQKIYALKLKNKLSFSKFTICPLTWFKEECYFEYKIFYLHIRGEAIIQGWNFLMFTRTKPALLEKHMQVHYFNTWVSHSVENDTIMINHSLLRFNENIRNWMYGAASRGCKRAEAKLQSVNHPGTKFVNEWHIKPSAAVERCSTVTNLCVYPGSLWVSTRGTLLNRRSIWI